MNKQKIVAAVIVALSCFGVFVIILPAYNDITVTREELSARQDVLKQRTELLGQVEKWNEQYKKYADQISKLDVLLPEKKQADQIISSIQEISNQSGLIMTELNIAGLNNRSSGTNTGYQSSLITVLLAGTYPQFMNFLKNLEQSLRIYDINNLVVSEATNSKGVLNFQLKINTSSIK